MTSHTPFQSSFFALSVILFAPAIATAQAPAAKPAPISCSIRHTPSSPGDIAYSHAKWSDAADLYRKEDQAAGVDGERTHNALIRTLIHAGKVADAETDAKAWAAKSPKDAWALDALGEVQFRKAEIDAAGNTFRDAAAIDFCIAQTHADYARYLTFTGFHASAKKQYDIAHKLDPIDDEISATWVHYQPRAQRLAAVTDYLTRTTFLTDKERKDWEAEKTALSQPPAYPCTLTTPMQSTSVPFHGIQDGPRAEILWGLVVAFNGQNRRLEIDTGASGLLITKRAAAALNLPVEHHEKIGGIGDEGDVNSSIAKVDSLKIGNLLFKNCAVTIMEKTPESMSTMDGLIGGDVFQNFLLTLDFPGKVLKVDPLPALPNDQPITSTAMETGVDKGSSTLHDRYVDPSMASWTKVFRSGHDLLLPVRLNSGPIDLFIMDTGAQVSLISPSAASQVGKIEKGTAGMQIYGISGEVKKLYTTGHLTLDFAGLRQPSDGMIATDTTPESNDTGVEVSGLLGAVTLHQLTLRIDYRDQLVNFTYDASRITHCSAVDTGTAKDDCY